jgi:hypothetical protein
MCVNCLNQAEVAVAHVALATALLKEPAHRLLAEAGLVAAPDPVVRDVRTVAFLRALDLDPVEALGAEAVAAADERVAQPVPVGVGVGVRPARRASSARPIGSHSLLSAQ